MKNRTERLLILLPWLVRNPNKELKEIASIFDITVKQLLDDLALLTFVGPTQYGGDLVDIVYDERGVSVVDHQGLNRPVSLSSDQLSLLALGLMAIADQAPVDIQSAASTLLDKLIGSNIAATHDPIDLKIEVSNTKEKILSAVQSCKPITFQYKSKSDELPKLRTISPFKYFLVQNKEYIEGVCHDSLAIRTFRISRMLNLEVVNSGIEYQHNVVELSYSANLVMLKCLVTNTALEYFTNFPSFELLGEQSNGFLVKFGIFNQHFGVKLGLAFRDCLQILEPVFYESEIVNEIQAYLGDNA